jgi:hypothetical protein
VRCLNVELHGNSCFLSKLVDGIVLFIGGSFHFFLVDASSYACRAMGRSVVISASPLSQKSDPLIVEKLDVIIAQHYYGWIWCQLSYNYVVDFACTS